MSTSPLPLAAAMAPQLAKQAGQAHALLRTMFASTRPADFSDPSALVAALRALSDACSASVPRGAALCAPSTLVVSLEAENAALLQEVGELRRGVEAADIQALRRVMAENEELARDNEQLQGSARGVSEAAAAEVGFWRQTAADQQAQVARNIGELEAQLVASRAAEQRLGAELREARATASGSEASLAAQIATLQRQNAADREARDTLQHGAEEQRQVAEQESARVADALRRAAGCEREAAQLRQEARGLRAELLRHEDEQAQLQALLHKHEALARSFGTATTPRGVRHHDFA